MVDLQETPATPPEVVGGDERAGYLAAGGVLLALGWGLGVGVNVGLHWMARTSPFQIWTVHFGGTMGAYSTAVLGLGIVTGLLGIALLRIGFLTARGPLVLPGPDFPAERIDQG